MRPFTQALRNVWLLCLLSVLCALGCSAPRDATPLPEPPSLNPMRIGISEVTALTAVIAISGSEGAAPGNAVVRVTNLDSTSGPLAATASASGAFEFVVPGQEGDELRLQALVFGQRSAPLDLTVVGTSPPTLVPSPRHDCVSLNPGFELVFPGAGSKELTLHDACTGPLTAANARQRRSLPSFSLPAGLPLEVAAGESSTLTLPYGGPAGAGVEDTLFLDLTTAGSTLRYPITLAAP